MKTFKLRDMEMNINVKHPKLLVLWALITSKTKIDLNWLFNFCVKVG